LQVLLHSLLPDHLGDAHLRIDIKGVGIQIGNLLSPPHPLFPLLVLHLPQDGCESLGVIDDGGKFWSLADGLLSHLWIAQQLESYSLGIRITLGSASLVWLLLRTRGLCLGLSCRACPTTCHISDVQRQHLAVPDLELLHGLGGIVQELSVVVEMLGGGRDAGFGLDGLFQGADGGVRWDFEGEEIVIILRRGRYAYGDTPWTSSATIRRNRVIESVHKHIEFATWREVGGIRGGLSEVYGTGQKGGFGR